MVATFGLPSEGQTDASLATGPARWPTKNSGDTDLRSGLSFSMCSSFHSLWVALERSAGTSKTMHPCEMFPQAAFVVMGHIARVVPAVSC